jgi:hypothetical protein
MTTVIYENLKIETPDQRIRREIQAQTMDVQRQNLRSRLARRIRIARENGNEALLNQLLAESKSL